MKVNTKLNVGDKAYVMSENKVQEVKIDEIIITISVNSISILYTMDPLFFKNLSSSRYYDSEIFATKQQLLDSL